MTSQPSSLAAPVLRFALLATAIFGLTFSAAALEVQDLRINVRASVEYKGMKKPTEEEMQQAKAHQRIYALVQVKLIPSFEKLLKPINELALANELRKTLAHNGYEEAYVGGPRPEIALVVYYGRGWLVNPYLSDAPDQGGLDDVPTVSPTFKQLMKQKEPGYEEKIQRANGEKLAIIVAASTYPKPGEKPHRLWLTVINIDSPDYRDLNTFIGDMLAAGGSYFGRRNANEEAEIWKPMPDGHVKLGELKDLGDVALPAKKK